MSLKIWQLALMLFLLMAVSGVVSGKNLLIGGIWQSSEDQLTNQNWAKLFSDKYGAEYEYIPTYSNGAEDVADVTKATPKMVVYKDSSTGAIAPLIETASWERTDNNGLNNPLLDGVNNDHYDIIYAHSGGARTAVTALLYQGVTADTLVLIAPAMGSEDRELYLWEIQQLLYSEPPIVKNIVVYQSVSEHKGLVGLPLSNLWEGIFNPGDIVSDKFKIYNLNDEQLGGKTGIDAHKQMWDTALNLELDRDPLTIAPKPTDEELLKYNIDHNAVQGNFIKDPIKELFQKGLGFPLLSSTSDTSGFSSQNKEETDVPETSGATYLDKANNVWYVDAFSWSGDRSLLEKPAAPYRFISGEINTYGYNWIYLPLEQTGLRYSPGYADWVADTLASMGISAPTAGYGLLVDESQNGGGGW